MRFLPRFVSCSAVITVFARLFIAFAKSDPGSEMTAGVPRLT